MPRTYEPIASQTLSSAAASLAFSSIGAGWTDLRLVVEAKSPSGLNGLFARVNGDSSTLYSTTILAGTGSSAVSSRDTGNNKWYANYGSYATASDAQFLVLDLLSYANTNVFKTALIRSSAASSGVDRMVGLYRSTSAITSVSVFFLSANLPAGSSASLYGIKAA